MASYTSPSFRSAAWASSSTLPFFFACPTTRPLFHPLAPVINFSIHPFSFSPHVSSSFSLYFFLFFFHLHFFRFVSSTSRYEKKGSVSMFLLIVCSRKCGPVGRDACCKNFETYKSTVIHVIRITSEMNLGGFRFLMHVILFIEWCSLLVGQRTVNSSEEANKCDITRWYLEFLRGFSNIFLTKNITMNLAQQPSEDQGLPIYCWSHDHVSASTASFEVTCDQHVEFFLSR